MNKVMHIFYWTIIVLLLLFGGCQYFKKVNRCPEIVETITTTDTIKGKKDSYRPTPSTGNTSGRVSRETGRETLPSTSKAKIEQPGTADKETEIVEIEVPETNNVPEPITYYHDSLEIKKDTQALGKVYVDDQVQGSQIIDRRWRFEFYKQTTTNTVQDPKRNKWFIGIQGLGNQTTPVRWLGGSIAVMPKKANNIYLIGAGPMDGKIYFQGGAFIKIGKR